MLNYRGSPTQTLRKPPLTLTEFIMIIPACTEGTECDETIY